MLTFKAPCAACDATPSGLCRTHRLAAYADELYALLDEISVPESFPEWDAARRELLQRIDREAR